MKESSILIILSILGMLIHSLIKMNSLKKDYEVANKTFDWRRDYLYRDYLGIIISLLASFAWYFLFAEAVAKFSAIQSYTRLSFFVMGGMGSFVAQLLFSASKKYIRKVVDVKTNIADGKE